MLSTVNELVAARLAAAQGLGQEAHDAGGRPSASGGVKKVARAPGGAADPDTQAALDRIAAASSSLAEHGAQRCGMAQEYYDYVDALIVRLDKDLAACDAELFKHSDAAGGKHRGKGACVCLDAWLGAVSMTTWRLLFICRWGRLRARFSPAGRLPRPARHASWRLRRRGGCGSRCWAV